MLLCGVCSKHMISQHSDYIFPFCSARKCSIFPLEPSNSSVFALTKWQKLGNGKEVSKGWSQVHSDFYFLYLTWRALPFPSQQICCSLRAANRWGKEGRFVGIFYIILINYSDASHSARNDLVCYGQNHWAVITHPEWLAWTWATTHHMCVCVCVCVCVYMCVYIYTIYYI